MSPLTHTTLCETYITPDVMPLQMTEEKIPPPYQTHLSPRNSSNACSVEQRVHAALFSGAQGVKCASLCALELAMMASIRAN